MSPLIFRPKISGLLRPRVLKPLHYPTRASRNEVSNVGAIEVGLHSTQVPNSCRKWNRIFILWRQWCLCISMLDFKKAFDKVPHQRLLLKLKAHGIGNSMINWIEKWLIDRRQRVVVDGEVSNWKSVLSGVPQGSVLGPILFLIYINDLDDDITSKVLKFADDTKVFRKIKSDADRQHLQDDLNKLIEWSEKWQMLFNFESVSASTQDMGMKMHNIQWVVLY